MVTIKNPVTVAQGGSPTPPTLEEKDINFWDYDGTLLYSYTHAEIQSLSELPAVPDHSAEGIASDGWTHDLAYLKTTYYAHVGACYKSAHSSGDKSTLIVVTTEQANQSLTLYLTGTNVVVDWGDGTVSPATSYADEADTGPSHTFSAIGTYTIAIYSTEATYDIALGKKYSSTAVKSLFGGKVSTNGTSWSALSAAYSYHPKVSRFVVGQASIRRGGLMFIMGVDFFIVSRYCTGIAERGLYQSGTSRFNTLIIPPEVGFIDESVSSTRTGIGYNVKLETVIAPMTAMASGAYSTKTVLSFSGIIKRIEGLVDYSGGNNSNAYTTGYLKKFKVRGKPQLNYDVTTCPWGGGATLASLAEEIVFDDRVLSSYPGICTGCWGPNHTDNGVSGPQTLVGVKTYDFRACSQVVPITTPTSDPSYDLSVVIRPDAVIVVPDALYADWIADANWSAVANQIIKASDYEAS